MIRKRGFAGWLQRAWAFFTGESPEEETLQGAAAKMLEGLRLLREATAFAMARADEARKDLQTALDEREAYHRQALDFLGRGDEAAAQRCLMLQAQAEERMKSLTERFTSLKATAERKVLEFKSKEREVQSRVAALPELQREAQALAIDEDVARKTDELQLAAPQGAFDAAEREIRIRRKQLEGQALLTADPNLEIDARIRQAVGDVRVAQLMAGLRTELAASSTSDVIIDAEIVDDPVTEAQRLLDAPRYAALRHPGSTERAVVPVGRKSDER